MLKSKKVAASQMKIGVLGLGNIGQGVVKNLLKSGHSVMVWNRSTSKTKEFTKAGASKGNCFYIFKRYRVDEETRRTPRRIIGGIRRQFSDLLPTTLQSSLFPSGLTPADVVAACDIVFCCVATPEASKDVVSFSNHREYFPLGNSTPEALLAMNPSR